MRPMHSMTRNTALAIIVGLCAFACQEGGVTALSNGTEAPANGGASTSGSDEATPTAADGLSPGQEPAVGGSAGTGLPNNANLPQTQAPTTGNANNANLPVATSPNAPATTPVQASTPLDWSQLRYAFSTSVLGQQGDPNVPGVEIYLTSNRNFCVNLPNLGTTDSTLTQGDKFVAISFDAPSGGATAGTWAGPGDYGKKALQVRSVGANAYASGFCKVVKDSAVYNGNVVIVDDANGYYSFTVQAQLPTTAANGNANTTLAPVNIQLVATPCVFNWQYYAATNPAESTTPPEASSFWRPMTEVRCQAASQAGVNKRRQ